MMKWIMYLVLAVLCGFAWNAYSKKGKEMDDLKHKIEAIRDKGDSDTDDLVPKMETDLKAMEDSRTVNGIFLTFLGAGLAGIFFVTTVLPFFAQTLSQGMIGSNEKVEKDAMSMARSLVAQGDYQGAIEAYKQASLADPLNRLPWVEIVKLQKEQLEDPQAAIATIRHALESQEWEVNDAAYFLFRLAELYDEVEGDRASAVAIMNQVIEQFPSTRHSANAAHKLHEWSVQDAAGGLEAEEAAFLARMKNTPNGPQ
jgi:tetratricopeptide (TPR) repeat protein